MLPDCLDFVVFLAVNFQRWCFVVQSIGLVASEEVGMKNVMKSAQRLASACCQVQAVSRLADALQNGEGSNVAILKLSWAL